MKFLIGPLRDMTDKYPLLWQFFKFCVVGVTNLAIYLVIYWLMTRLLGWHYIFASIGGFAIAVTWSFFLNMKWTFRHGGGSRHRQYVTFIVANLISMGISLCLLTLCIEVLHLYDIAAQIGCSIIVAFFNFGLNKLWTFRKIEN